MTEPERVEFGRPGHFTVGCIGEPGHRLFYVQIFGNGTELSIKCEKQQAQALAEQLLRLVADLPGSDEAAAAGVAPAESLPPSELAWTVGAVRIGLDPDQQVVVLFEELMFDDEGTPIAGDGASASVLLSPLQVHAFAAQVTQLVASGRPICRLCDQPMDPDGHACPRLN